METSRVKVKMKKENKGCWTRMMDNSHSKHFFFFVVWLIFISFGALFFMWLEWPAMIKAKNDKVAMFKDWKKVMKPESYKKVIEEMGDPEEDRVGGLFTYGRMWVLSYTLVTTIGYGAIVPITPAGQFFTTIYSMITIPFSLYIFASVADEILDWCTEYMLPADAKSKAAFKKFDTDKNGTLDKRELHEALNEVGFKLNSNDMDNKWKVFKKDTNGDVTYNEFRSACKELQITKFGKTDQKFKYRFIITLSIIHTIIGTVVFHMTEKAAGWSVLESFYFCIVTTTTVGLGDYVPSSTAGLIILPIWSFLGLGLIAALLELIAVSWFKLDESASSQDKDSSYADEETEKLL